jgi:hypothetical protein
VLPEFVADSFGTKPESPPRGITAGDVRRLQLGSTGARGAERREALPTLNADKVHVPSHQMLHYLGLLGPGVTVVGILAV